MFGNHLLPHVPVEFARDLTSQNGVVHVMQHVHGVYSNVQIAAESQQKFNCLPITNTWGPRKVLHEVQDQREQDQRNSRNVARNYEY